MRDYIIGILDKMDDMAKLETSFEDCDTMTTI